MDLSLGLALGGGGPRGPAGPVAPTLSLLLTRDGLVVTITAVATGRPTPDVTLTTLTLDGVNALGDATGTGPWSYVVPAAAVSQTVAWTVTATNSEGVATASGSEVVGAEAPAAPVITAVFWTSAGAPGQGHRSFTLAEAPPAGHTVLFTGGAVLNPTVYLGGLSWREAAVNGGSATPVRAAIRDPVTGLTSEVSEFMTLTAAKEPVAPPAPSLVGGENEVTLTVGATSDARTFPVTSYDWRLSTDNTFATVDRSGTMAVPGAFTATFVDAGTYYVQSRAVSAWGPSAWSAASSAATVTDAEAPAAGLVSVAGAIEAEATLNETATALIWTLDGEVLGTATLTDLAEGPVCVRQPTVDPVSPTLGQTVTATPGLWAYLAVDGTLSLTREWLTADEPIPGETGLTHVTTATDLQTGLVYRETATNSEGSRDARADAIATPFPLWVQFGTPAPYLLQPVGAAAALPSTPEEPAYGFTAAFRFRLPAGSDGSSRHLFSVTGSLLLSRRSTNDIEFSAPGAWRLDDPDVFTTSDGAFFSMRTNNTPTPSEDRETFLAGSVVSVIAMCDLRGGLGGDPDAVAALWWHKDGSTRRYSIAQRAAGSTVAPETHFLRTDYLPLGTQRATGGAVTTPWATNELAQWFWATTQAPFRWQVTDPEAADYAPALFFDVSSGASSPPRQLSAIDPNGVIDGVAPGIFISGPPSQWASGTNRAPGGVNLTVTNPGSFTLGAI